MEGSSAGLNAVSMVNRSYKSLKCIIVQLEKIHLSLREFDLWESVTTVYNQIRS